MEHVVVRGSAYERGYQLGARLGARHADFTAPAWDKLAAKATTHWPPYRLEAVRGNMLLALLEHAPEVLDELCGMADGSGVPLHTVISRELAASISLVGPGLPAPMDPRGRAAALATAGCTNVAARTSDRGPVLAKTDDGAPAAAGTASPFTLLEERPYDGLPFLIVGKHGQLKVELGLNAAGLAIGQSSEPTLPGADGFGVPEFLLARVALARCHTTAEAVEFLQATPSAGKGLSMMVVDAMGDIAAVEKWAARTGVRRPEGDALAFANDFLATAMQDFPARGDKQNSADRLQTVRATLPAAPDSIRLDSLQALLATHAPAGSICRHGHATPDDANYATLGSFLVLCRERTLLLAEGPACAQPFQTVTLVA